MMTATPITQAETPNAVCAICQKHGKLVAATHDVTQDYPGDYRLRAFRCDFHTERARRSEARHVAYLAAGRAKKTNGH